MQHLPKLTGAGGFHFKLPKDLGPKLLEGMLLFTFSLQQSSTADRDVLIA